MADHTEIGKKEKLWTLSFLFLWQGQFVSVLGDVIYELALGFWVLEVTKSKALMGTFMAATVLPKVIVAPFAGVLVDRMDRKKILFLADFARGISVVFIGIASIVGFVKMWMVLVAGIILGLCGAFFSPGINSVLPDVVPKSKLVNANSVFSTLYAAGNIFGFLAGGVLYRVIGAAFMFLFNGLSYIFSAITILFMKIPKTVKENEASHFFADMKEGFVFVWSFKALRNAIIVSSLLNFLFNMALVLNIPLFEETEWLGSTKYGIAMAFATAGMLLGMVYTSIFDIKPSKRFALLIFSGFVSSVLLAVFALLYNFYFMLIVLFVGGLFLAITNVLFNSSIQITVPQKMRGKVFALMGTLTQGLTPLAMALGGILAEFIPIRTIIFSCFSVSFITFVPLLLMASFKRFINYNEEEESLEDIM
ncbi:MAG: MFS transporter [Clostridia bacterium]|nr:MFS transporter [Clostridia bacterium]